MYRKYSINTNKDLLFKVWMWFLFWVSKWVSPFPLMCYSSSKGCAHHLNLCCSSYCNNRHCISKIVSGFQSDLSYCILNHISSFLLFILVQSVIFFSPILSVKRHRSCSQSADVTQQQEDIETGEWSCVKSLNETKQDAQEDERIEVGDDAS